MTDIKNTLGIAVLLVAALLIRAPAMAHHNSGAAFDLEKDIIIEGTITRFDWKNPHLYFFVESTDLDGDKTLWRVEGHPLAFMRRMGWSRETLVPGDEVTVEAKPSRNPNRNSGLLRSVTVVGRDIPPVSGESIGKLFTSDSKSPTEGAGNLFGTWVTLVINDSVAFVDDPDKLAPTELGLEQIAAFDEATMHTGLDCVPMTAPAMMVIPDTKSIESIDGTILIRGEFDATDRTIYLDGRAPSGRSRHGHSLGRWSDDVLIIETRHFSDHRMGNAFSLPSGSEKRLTEKLALDERGTRLKYSFELFDPDYMIEPFSGESAWAYRPDLAFSLGDCDVENARQFIGE